MKNLSLGRSWTFLFLVAALGAPGALSAQESTTHDELSARIDDAVVNVRRDRPWVTPAPPSSEPDPTAAPRGTTMGSCCQHPWRFRMTPFFWAAGMDGSLEVRGQTVDVDVSITENLETTFDNYKFAGSVHFEANRGRWSILTNLIYIDIGNEDTIGNLAPVHVDWDYTTLIGSGMVGYQFACLPLGCSGPCFRPTLTLDALAGARLYYMSASIDLDPGPHVDGDKLWLDPIVGVRALFHVSPWLTFNILADVGGFGVGSDLSWELIAGLSIAVAPCVDLVAGWAILDVDYESGSFGYDVQSSGPYLGATFRF